MNTTPARKWFADILRRSAAKRPVIQSEMSNVRAASHLRKLAPGAWHVLEILASTSYTLPSGKETLEWSSWKWHWTGRFNVRPWHRSRTVLLSRCLHSGPDQILFGAWRRVRGPGPRVQRAAQARLFHGALPDRKRSNGTPADHPFLPRIPGRPSLSERIGRARRKDDRCLCRSMWKWSRPAPTPCGPIPPLNR